MSYPSVVPRGAIDLQQQSPRIGLALDSVGVAGVERSIQLGAGRSCLARITAHIDLPHNRTGAHMSRFSEQFARVVEECVPDRASSLDRLAHRIAERLLQCHDASAASVEVNGRLAIEQLAPASLLTTHDVVELHGRAYVSEVGSRRATGVSADGINACPCAQGLVEAQARNRLEAEGFSQQQIVSILQAVPAATHNQRARATLTVETARTGFASDAFELLPIVQGSMSAPVHDLLKRPDELHVVEQAHRNPKFVEDSVREMLLGLLQSDIALQDEDVVSARQVNFETIHAHDVFAERTALVGELRRELER